VLLTFLYDSNSIPAFIQNWLLKVDKYLYRVSSDSRQVYYTVV